MKKAIGMVLVAGVAFAAPGAMGAEQAEAKVSAKVIQKRVQAKTRSNVAATFGHLYGFRIYGGKCNVVLRLWDCEWTGRQDGWRYDGTTFGMLRNGRPYDVFSVADN